MGKFKITDHESGKTVIVSGDAAPNDQEAEQIFSDAGLRDRAQQAAPQATQQPAPHGALDTAVDMARVLPGGLATSVSSIAGLPGDISAGLNNAADWAMNKVDPETVQKMQAERARPHAIPSPPTSGEAMSAVTKPFGGKYEPKTTAGQYAETVASFLPNALAPGSLVNKVGRVVVPGLASEEAGQQAKGTKWEPVARTVGALAGGVGEGIAEGIGHARAHPIMSSDELGKAKTAAYKAADQAGVVISPQAFQTFASDLAHDVTKNNVVQADVHKNALAGLSIIQDEAAAGVPISLARADKIRQAVKGAVDSAASSNGDDLRVAMKVKRGLDDYLDSLEHRPQDVLSGDPATAVPILKQARSLAQREFKAAEIQKIIDLSKNQAAGNNSALGTGQAMRQQFKNLNAQLIKEPGMAKSFSPAERAAIDKVVNGGPIENALRLFGKLAPTNAISMGVGPTLGATVGAGIGGPLGAGIGAVGVPAIGAAARGGASLLTQRNAKLAEELMRAGQANPGATSIPRNVILSTLLAQGSH